MQTVERAIGVARGGVVAILAPSRSVAHRVVHVRSFVVAPCCFVRVVWLVAVLEFCPPARLVVNRA